MRRPLSVVLARLPFKRPFMIGVAALLLVGLVGAGVWWQVGAHASPTRENLTVVSDKGDQYSLASGATGSSVITYGHNGCTKVDLNGICTAGVWMQIVPAIPDAHWIWPTTQWDPVKQAGNPVTFTKQFDIPQQAFDVKGQILITADNGYDLQVNGTEVGSAHHMLTTDTYDLSTFLRTGTNIITAEVKNDLGGSATTNPAGLIFRADVSYIPDNTAPTTTASLAGTSGSNGWYRGPVTVTLQATDPDDNSSTILTNYSTDGGATWLAYDASTPVTFATDGQYTLLYYSVDQATNAEAIHSASINIDQVNPDLHVDASADQTLAPKQTFDVCSTDRPVRPTFAPTDATSGLDGSQGDSWTTPTTATGAGTYTYTAHATDMAGNKSSQTLTYTVLYGGAYSGVLQPLQKDQTNSVNLNATIPFKFQLMCNDTPITTAVVSLSVKQGSGTAATKLPKKLSTVNTFTYDPTAQQYQLNVSTGAGYTNPDGSIAAFSAGTWTFTVSLDDGTSYDYTVQLS